MELPDNFFKYAGGISIAVLISYSCYRYYKCKKCCQ